MKIKGFVNTRKKNVFQAKEKKVSEAMFQSQMKVVGNNERKKNRILYF